MAGRSAFFGTDVATGGLKALILLGKRTPTRIRQTEILISDVYGRNKDAHRGKPGVLAMNSKLIFPAGNTIEILFLRGTDMPVPSIQDRWDDVAMVEGLYGSGVGEARLDIQGRDITNLALLQVVIPNVGDFDLCWVLSAGPRSRLIRAVFPTGPRTERCTD